ncbi:restriction endonuclease subunit S [Elizabethkingia sp. HX WHF]|uniref:restriction endonuclease subunit S n=1 Tax=Elizabethkingia sp. HX WHF TaxID=3003190 RepID=UPI002A2409C8|nr:restriction endonuclease subunit S [Elizabethkingia sp. HX WHF]
MTFFPNSGNIPKLRFSEFAGEWEERYISEVISSKSKKYNPENSDSNYPSIELESLSQDSGELLSTFDSKNQKSIKNVFNSGDVLFGKLRPYLKKYYLADFDGVCSSEIWVLKSSILDSNYLYAFVQSNSFISLTEISSGSKMPRADWNLVSSSLIVYPSNTNERKKIGKIIKLINSRIQTQRKIIEGLITLKIQSRNKLFKQIIKDDYEAFMVEEILNYEQPTKYIVSNTDYSSDKSLIPVLTANKAFILGYTNEDWGIYNKGKCIVLDDFTLDLKYVDFSFKIKSSAIKLLTPKNNIDLKFVFEYFSFLNLSSNEHKRHYISEIQPMLLNIPSIDIQNNISNFLLKLDAKINLETELLNQFENQKKYLLQNLFV